MSAALKVGSSMMASTSAALFVAAPVVGLGILNESFHHARRRAAHHDLERSVRRHEATLVREYGGSSQAAAMRDLNREAQALGPHGYVVTSQSWAAGSYGCADYLVVVALAAVALFLGAIEPLLLSLLVISVLLFGYMLVVKPKGTLVVSYAYRPEPAPPAAVPQGPSPRAHAPGVWPDARTAARLAALDRMLDQNPIDPEEYATKRREILAKP